MGRDLSSLTNKSLVSLMKSAAFGTVQSDDQRGLKKSALFAGLAKIKAHFDPETQTANRQAREDFAKALIKEFGISGNSGAGKSLKEFCTGENSGKPLSIRTAQRMIGTFLSMREGNRPPETPQDSKALSEMVKDFQRYEHAVIHDDQMRFEQTADRTDENIGHQDLGSLKNQLLPLHSRKGEAAREEMIEMSRQWLRLADREDTREAALSLLKEMGL